MGFFGHRLALGRDRRKEFNEAAQPVLVWLLRQESDPSCFTRAPSQLEMHTFVSCLSSQKRSEFNAALADFRSVCGETEQNSHGELSYDDPERVRAHAHKLLPFTERR